MKKILASILVLASFLLYSSIAHAATRTVFLTGSPGGASAYWAVPADFASIVSVEAIGAGGVGANGKLGSGTRGGGGNAQNCLSAGGTGAMDTSTWDGIHGPSGGAGGDSNAGFGGCNTGGFAVGYGGGGGGGAGDSVGDANPSTGGNGGSGLLVIIYTVGTTTHKSALFSIFGGKFKVKGGRTRIR